MNLLESIFRTKQMMGLNENDEKLNKLLEKIYATGIDSLSNKEKTFLYSLNKVEPTPEPNTLDYRIRVWTDRTKNINLIDNLIVHILKKNRLKSKVELVFLGLGIGYAWDVYVEHTFKFSNPDNLRAISILQENGFQVIEHGPVQDKPELPKRIQSKINKCEDNATMSLTPKHGHNLTDRQELDRISKILEQNNIKNRYISGANGKYKVNMKNSTKEEEDKMYIIFSNRGYDVDFINAC